MSLLAELHEMPVPAPASGSRWAVPFLHPTCTSTALITRERTLAHDELAVRVAAVVERLPDVATGRRLVHLPLTEHLDDVVGYLAVLAAGHVALVTGPQATSVTDRFAPDVRLAGADVEVISPDAQHLLHPDLALLLSTSGSTGSPKLVRLTHDNLAANADGIATALELDADDRAITSLPLHYCYGLSVLHSVLLVGGSVVVTDHSVTDDRFWRLQAEHRATLFAGVPHTFDLVGSRLRGNLPGLRLVTQAGGAMAPERVTEIAETGRAKGWQLAVMYGQTEATARMAVLPGRDVLAHPDSVGAPIANSSFRLDHDVPGGSDEVGELVFTGPGVMLGYAEHADELALGRMVTELRTGDLGRIGDDGLVRIVGRRDQVAKVMGLRIDLGRVSEAITAAGHDVVVTSDAQRLLVTLVADPAGPGTRESAREVRALAAEASGLPPGSVVVAPIAGLPRLANGKTDRAGCRRHALDHAERADDAADAADGDRLGATVGVVASALGRDDIDAGRSFTELGGDSYSLVQTSVRLEKVLGPLPSDWHRVPLTELVRTTSGRTGAISWLETPVVLRAAAVLAICASHIGLVSWPGGAHTLLVVAGWAMARFTLVSSDPAEHRRRGIRAVVALVVPSVLVALAVRLAGGGYDWANVFLVNWLVGTVVSDGPRVQLWFIEALLACIVLVLALMAVPATRRAYLRSPWAWSMGLAGLALVPRYLLIPDPTGSISGLPGSVLWLFAVGMALGVATTRRQHLAALALTAVGMVGFFFDPTRGATVLAAVVVLALVPRIPLPRLLAPLTGLLATASLHIYLVQFRIYPYIDNGLIALVLSLAAGVAAWALLHPPTRALTELIAPTTPRHRHRHPEDTPCVVAP
ncbi:non-ribosomal peptide synthetase [Janibacter cremeus]|uniref:non-ribosomal peptide synthetase n=1 Tax=Janibacter cremeus TaxID=1285192 RepID=UPI0023F9B470|nr:non-ribosomal peptide synthetase [Janibacter cremeus]WEV78084.1 non-ribosomal peptide synthetase [Janibacter cremeus]